MSYQALYRTYRPQTFDEVVGQKYIVTALKNAVKQNKIAHAYLFCGPRGTGKTTIARLLAKAVNCENKENPLCDKCESCKMISEGTHPDVVEIDGASYGKVETARDLIEKVKYAPLQGKYKVYIIDEVHMLSDSAFNALLKTLEEPPAHAIFILATTDPQKVLSTIISRCQRYDFTKVDSKEIYERLQLILKNEKIEYEDEALKIISNLAEGGLRDALSILDQVIAYSPDGVKASDVYDVYGLTTPEDKYLIIKYAIDKNSKKLLDLLNKLFNNGLDIKRLTIDLIEIIKDCVVYSYTSDEQLLNNIDIKKAKSILETKTSNELLKMIDVLLEANNNYRFVSNANSTFEVAVLKLLEINKDNKEKNDKTINTINKSEEKEQVKEEKIVVHEVKTYGNEELLQLLVGANKQKRTQIETLWPNISDYRLEDQFTKIINNLNACSIKAVGDDYIILTVASLSSAEIINEKNNKQNIAQLTNKLLGQPYEIYALNNANYLSLLNEYKIRRENNTLPKPKEKKEETKTLKIDETIDTMTHLFGKDAFEIIEK